MVAFNVHAEQMAAVPYTLATPARRPTLDAGCEYAAASPGEAAAGFAKLWGAALTWGAPDPWYPEGPPYTFRLAGSPATFRLRRLAGGRWGVFEARGKESQELTEHPHDPR